MLRKSNNTILDYKKRSKSMLIIEMRSLQVIYIMILWFIFARKHIWKIVLCKTDFLYCFERKKLKKKEKINTVSSYEKRWKINFDNRNEIFTGDLYNDFMLHVAWNHVWNKVLSKTVFFSVLNGKYRENRKTQF